MPFNQPKHRRRSIRLQGYDYASPGAYFVTICVHWGKCSLGKVVDGEMQMNRPGRVARDFWAQVPIHFPNVSIDAFVIMPNHLHAIIVIHESKTAGCTEQGGETPPLPSRRDEDRGCGDGETLPERPDERSALSEVAAGAPSLPSQPQSQIRRPTLGQIVAYYYKYQTARQINQVRRSPGNRFWQRNYWEHIIRDETSLNHIRDYILTNTARWAEDQLHPDAAPNPFNQWPPPGST
jgi:putative transposase